MAPVDSSSSHCCANYFLSANRRTAPLPSTGAQNWFEIPPKSETDTLAALRAFRARTPVPAWARRAVGEVRGSLLTAYCHNAEGLLIQENTRPLLIRINANKQLPAEAVTNNRIGGGSCIALLGVSRLLFRPCRLRLPTWRAADGWPSSAAPPVTRHEGLRRRIVGVFPSLRCDRD